MISTENNLILVLRTNPVLGHRCNPSVFSQANLEHHAVAVINSDKISGVVHFHQVRTLMPPISQTHDVVQFIPRFPYLRHTT